MILNLLGLTFQFVGTLSIAVTVWTVHGHVHNQKRINRTVLRKMGRGRWISAVGIAFIVVGFILNLLSLFDS